MIETQFHFGAGGTIASVSAEALEFFKAHEAANIGDVPTKYFFIFNGVEIVWKVGDPVTALYDQYDAAVAGWTKEQERDRQRAAILDPTALEIHNETMKTVGRHFRVFTRIGRWGCCNECPTDGNNDYYPEFCVNTADSGHQRGLAWLVDHHNSWSEATRHKLTQQRQQQRDAI